MDARWALRKTDMPCSSIQSDHHYNTTIPLPTFSFIGRMPFLYRPNTAEFEWLSVQSIRFSYYLFVLSSLVHVLVHVDTICIEQFNKHSFVIYILLTPAVMLSGMQIIKHSKMRLTQLLRIRYLIYWLKRDKKKLTCSEGT